jgi:hypothetical protein
MCQLACVSKYQISDREALDPRLQHRGPRARRGAIHCSSCRMLTSWVVAGDFTVTANVVTAFHQSTDARLSGGVSTFAVKVQADLAKSTGSSKLGPHAGLELRWR